MKDKEKILIVGINSFLGKRLVLLIKDAFYIIGVYHKNLDKDVIANELVSIDEVELLVGQDIKTVFIVSAYIPYTQSESDNINLIEANVLLPYKICGLFKSSRIVFCSSVSVYDGLNTKEVIDENTDTCTINPYALSKLWAEQIVKQSNNYTIVRFSSIYGPGMTNKTFIPKIIESAILKNKIVLLGKGERLQNYIHVGDAVFILMTLAMKKSENGVYLGVGEYSYSNFEVAKLIRNITSCAIDFASEDSSVSYLYGNGKIKEVLGERYQFVDMKKGLEELIEWKRKEF